MVEIGTRVRLTKGYRGEKGTVIEKIDSLFEFYVIKLDQEINIVVGPSAFVTDEDLPRPQHGTIRSHNPPALAASGSLPKGLRKNNFTELAPRFGSDLFDPRLQSHRNSGTISRLCD